MKYKHNNKTIIDMKTYKKNWDQKRKQINKEKQAGNPICRNLAFLETIIHRLKLNFSKVSELTGISQQLMSYWILSDDVRLFRLIELFEKLGITLKCSLVAETASGWVGKNDTFTVEFGEVPDFTMQIGDKIKDEVIGRLLLGDGRLKFIAELIDKKGMGLVEFCHYMGYSYPMVYSWFAKDDIKVSRVYEIAKRTNCLVNWSVSKSDI